VTHRRPRNEPPPCAWCGSTTRSEASFNRRTIPLCGTCIGRLDRARREPKHAYMLRALSRRLPPLDDEAAEGEAAGRLPRRDRRQPDARPVASSGSPSDGSAKRDPQRRPPLGADAREALQRESTRARRQVAAALGSLSAEARDRLAEAPNVGELRAEVRAAAQAGDRKRADDAIAAWRRDWLATFEEARSA
jgi:hypothetical protein